MPPPTSPYVDSSSRWVLRRRDQAAVAALVLVALFAMAIAWWRGGGEDLVEIDNQPHRELTFVVDINRAPWTEIAQLPSVGETLAKRIVDDREQHGPFRDTADLDRVPGLGPKTLERIQPYVRFESAKERP